MIEGYFEDIVVGEKWASGSLTVDEARVAQFARSTLDIYPLHLDADYAATTRYGRPIAHGLLVLAAAAGLAPLVPGRVVALLGFDDVRFPTPTYVGDSISTQLEVLSKRQLTPFGLVELRQEVRRNDGAVVCRCVAKLAVARREPGRSDQEQLSPPSATST